MKLAIVLSDLHIGSGHHRGRVNLFDDFREDGRFAQLLTRYSTGRYADAEVDLVLNGDIFDLLKVSVNGKFPDEITERLALTKFEQCVRGHPRVFEAMRGFLAAGKTRITYQPGNHDMELFFPGVQAMFCRAVTGDDTHARVRFITDEPSFTDHGVQYHHGHQFEAIHAMDFGKLFLTRGHREPVLNLPWGSLFILHVVSRLLRERPHLDKVMPFWPLVAGGMLFDTRFTLKLLGTSALAYARARLNPVFWQKRPFQKLTKFLSNDIGFFEGLDHFARRILATSPTVDAVVMGHTHCEMLRTYPRGKSYVNTGSWVPMVNLQLSNLGQKLALHYALLRWSQSGEVRTSLMRWHGHRPVSEEVIF